MNRNLFKKILEHIGVENIEKAFELEELLSQNTTKGFSYYKVDRSQRYAIGESFQLKNNKIEYYDLTKESPRQFIIKNFISVI